MQQQRRQPPMALSPVVLNNNNSNRPIRQTNRSMSSTVSPCFGCSQPMYNPFISNVIDRLWHPECVRCFICRCLLNDQCYSREGKLYCKDDFIKKYIHRCFACQNLVQSHELIRRIRAGRIYHAECFVCTKCKQTLKDDDISLLIKSDDSSLNDIDCVCQACSNPTDNLVKLSAGITSLSTTNGDESMDSENSNTINGKLPSSIDTQELKQPATDADIQQSTTVDNHIDEQQSMEVDEPPPPPPPPPAKEHSSSSSSSVTAPPITTPPPPKTTGRQSKVRQSTSSNGSKRSPKKSKATTPASRQKQTTANERKGRSPATRSKSSAVASTSSTVKTRSSNRSKKKNSRYRKRSFSSGSDEEETEDEDDNDTDFSEEDDVQDEPRDNNHSPSIKTKPTGNANDKKTEPEPVPIAAPPLPPPPAIPPQSLLSQAKMSEPLSLLSGLASNPMSISSIMKPDIPASFMPPNFNPAFPNPSQFLPPGFSLQPRLPMPPPPSTISQPQPVSVPESNRSSHSDSDSLDRSSSPSQMDMSTNVEPGTPARPVTSPKGSRQAAPAATTTSTHKPSALSSLLEFGTLPPSHLGDIRPTGSSANPFSFPFVTSAAGIPFSPQAAAGMATFYRPPFGISPTTMPLDMSQPTSKSSKKKSATTTDGDEMISQNSFDDSSSPRKKPRKSNSRSRAKPKQALPEDGNGIDEDNMPSPPPAASSRKKKGKKPVTENGNTNNGVEPNITNGNHSHNNLLAQMGLMNSSFMPPLPPSSTNGNSSGPSNAQQAQLAAMYNMAPHFAAYNAFPGAFNPAFAAYAGGYPAPYGFHPAFGASPNGQPFPFMSPTPPMNNPSTTEDKPSSIVVPETRPSKSRSKSNTGEEKKKPTTPRANKKKAVPVVATPGDLPVATECEPIPPMETPLPMARTPESTSTPTKRRMSESESEDFDEQQHSQTTNGKSGNESDGSIGGEDRSLNTIQSTSSSAAQEKKGGRTTIRPQQLEILCKAFDSCSKPNKTQREQLVADTGLSLRVIQVWFQNRRSKDRKGKASKDAPLDDDEDSQPSPPPMSESTSMNNTEI